MSKFYGSVVGYDKKYIRSAASTRRGLAGIEAAAQSWNGSVSVELFYDNNEESAENLMVRIRYQRSESTAHPDILCFDSTFENFIKRMEGEKC